MAYVCGLSRGLEYNARPVRRLFASLDRDGCRSVFSQGDNTGEDGNPLILYTGAFAQFVYLLPADPYLTAPSLDHFGLQVSSVPELEKIVARAKAYGERDARVNVIDVHARTTHGATSEYTLTSAYIGFLLPLMIELQHIERN